MTFTPGKSGNPRGRPKGAVGGRMRALATLDKIMSKRQNQKELAAAFEREFLQDPVQFFRTVIVPLLPREAKATVAQPLEIGWKSLVTPAATAAALKPIAAVTPAPPPQPLSAGGCGGGGWVSSARRLAGAAGAAGWTAGAQQR